jgi:hypothetical protein
MRINYIIATWNGKRLTDTERSYEHVLRNHLKQLGTLKHSLTQVTIMKPESGVVNSYYDVDLPPNAVMVECENKHLSYGQYLKGLERLHKDFDYHILIEDDYVPAVDDFDRKLIELYEEGSYLCSMVGGGGDRFHCAISHGIMSSKTYNLVDHSLISKFKVLEAQRAFSRMLIESGIRCVDYRMYYKIYYYSLGKITNYSITQHDEHIFKPIQCFKL